MLTAFLERSEKTQKCLLSQVLFNNGNQLNKAKKKGEKKILIHTWHRIMYRE